MSEKKILIVDDERDFAYVLSTHLKAHGYNIVMASDAVGARSAGFVFVVSGKYSLVQSREPDSKPQQL